MAALAPMELSSALDEVVATTSTLRLLDMALLLRDDPRLAFDYLRCLSVVDYGESMQVVYHLWSIEHRHKMALKVDMPAEDPRAPSLVSVWAGADWFEREGRDLFGVTFRGAPGPEAATVVGGVRGVSRGGGRSCCRSTRSISWGQPFLLGELGFPALGGPTRPPSEIS